MLTSSGDRGRLRLLSCLEQGDEKATARFKGPNRRAATCSQLRENRLLAGGSGMARPGLEPGTPRFSVVRPAHLNSLDLQGITWLLAQSRGSALSGLCGRFQAVTADGGTRLPFRRAGPLLLTVRAAERGRGASGHGPPGPVVAGEEQAQASHRTRISRCGRRGGRGRSGRRARRVERGRGRRASSSLG